MQLKWLWLISLVINGYQLVLLYFIINVNICYNQLSRHSGISMYKNTKIKISINKKK